MNYLTNKKFSFVSDALAPDAFGVVRFTGSEGISRCYTFEIELVSDNLEIDLKDIMESPARLTFQREEGDNVTYQGILLSFEQLHEVHGLAYYRAHLVPRLTWLSFTQHNQVFLDKSVPEIIEECLKDGGLTAADFEMRLQGSYDTLEYVCQYGESHLNFVSRWAEREGIYYFFEQADSGEKVVFTDTRISHTPYPQGDTIYYSPPSGLEALHEREIVKSFHCRMNLTPQSVMLKDYNYRKPSLDVTGSADVDSKGRGQVYSYGDHIRTPEEGSRLAKVRAEGIICRKEVFHGEGSVPYMMPGYTFTLKDHYRGSFNQGYLVTDVSHEGNQTGYLISGITAEPEEKGVFYRNSFSSIPSSVQFRPERASHKPRISGTLTARIDAAGSGQYAELDSQGRYKVVLPFDTSGRKNGKASAWVRMAQPYAGNNHGMHFPLHKDTEVLLTFIDGDPDRPIIAAAVPNPETQSPVNVNNQTMSAITTAGGNKIHIEDQEGSERILMHSPTQKSFVRIGAPNDPSVSDDGEDDNVWWHPGISESTGGLLDIQAKEEFSLILGESTDTVLGFRMWFTLLAAIDGVFGGRFNFQWPEHLAFKNGEVEAGADELRTSVRDTVNDGIHDKFTALENQITGHVQHDAIQRIAAVANRTRLATQRQQNNVQHVRALARDTHAQTVRLQSSASKTNTLVNDLKSIGVEMQTAGTCLRTTLNHEEITGADIENAGLHVNRGGQLMQAAGMRMLN